MTETTQLFLVRVWEHRSQFRASVRGVGDDATRLFTEAQLLGEYLREAGTPKDPPPDTPPALRSQP